MKIYRKQTGAVYEGDPVDCRELMQSGHYSNTPPTDEELAAANVVDSSADASAKDSVGAAGDSAAKPDGKKSAAKKGAGK